jgi:1-acyl-sn-glycerol-3-phosphate acyltransferase
MNGVYKHPLRAAVRLTWLVGELALTAVRFVPCVFFRPGISELQARAHWLQAGCRRLLRVFNAEINATGPTPTPGLLVSNHLSYLDILVLGALMPSIFVAKLDVKHWPVFGWLARLGGTLFADRTCRTQVGPLNQQIRAALEQGVMVILFPEGTSSDGRTVLPLKSALLEPATNYSSPVSASLIEYHLADGEVGEEVCYWKDMTFVPHLFNLLTKRSIVASVQFSKIPAANRNRKELARLLHSELLGLKRFLAVEATS